jgi:hypothetical protein
MLEPFFLLGYYFGMNWETYYKFPISYRRWLINRINEEIGKSADAQNGQTSKGFHNNTPDIRALTGKQRTNVPARLQRFT